MDVPLQLSVVIPHLNEPDNLRRCLHSLDAQRADGVRLEVIVVDNGSTQMPDNALSGVADVRLVRQPIPGPGPARNLGASMARADLLAFIDADCTAEPGWAAAIVGLMQSRPEIDLLGGDIGILMTDPQRPTAIEAYESIYSYNARAYVEHYGFAATGNMAVRTKVFDAVGPFGGISTMEDTEWGQRATGQGYLLAYLPEAKVLTPSCKSFPELAKRWDRHVAHEYRGVRDDRKALLRWLAVAAIIAASPVAETVKIMRSSRVSGIRNRALALACLTRVRLYRARLMFDLARRGHSASLVEGWNREK